MNEQQMLERIQELETLVCKQKQTIENLLSPRKGQTVTSAKAAALVKPKAGSVRHKLLWYIWDNPGITCAGIESRLNMKHQTVSARISEMRKAGWLEWNDDGSHSKYVVSTLGLSMIGVI